ncbi:hypothetical protein [Clostridioides difficile]|uniref:thiolase family protein n=1 Tax=Clostridioides difficile TaxID=1496 RepID=UPI000BC3D8CE|nr:hypothetical protein [Clostridioides difficile]PBF33230.1 hypothetical protein BGU41_00120 [Clostridioides difficile]
MIQSPYIVPSARFGSEMGDIKRVDRRLRDGHIDAYKQNHMGISEENIATKCEFTREMQDKLALESNNKAENSIKKNRFKEEIVSVAIFIRRRQLETIDK